MSRLYSRSIAEITIKHEGRVYKFKAMDWSLDLEQARYDVSQLGGSQVWCPGPTRGTLDFYIVPDGSPIEMTPDDEIDMRLEQLKRYMNLLGVPDDV